MPDYILTVKGPHPSTRHINAADDEGALALAQSSIEADYSEEGNPAVLQAQVTLTMRDATRYDGTVAQMLGRPA